MSRNNNEQEIKLKSSLSKSDFVTKRIAALPRKTWVERWAENLPKKTWARYLALGAVKTLNLAADNPFHLFFFLWGLGVGVNVFRKLATNVIVKQGGNPFGTGVELLSLIISLETMAFGLIGSLVLSTAWRLFRGPKKPDYTPFKEFVANIKKIHLDDFIGDDFAREKEIITDPQTAEECYEAGNFYNSVITWLADGADKESVGEKDIEGLWQAIGYILRNLRQEFPFQFLDYDKNQSKKNFITSDDDNSTKPSLQFINEKEEDSKEEKTIKQRMRELTYKQVDAMHGKTHTLEDQLRKNWSLLANMGALEKQKKLQQPASPTSLPSKNSKLTNNQKPGKRVRKYDLYNIPLLDAVKTEQDQKNDFIKLEDDFFTALPTAKNAEDSFYTVSPKVRKAAAKSDWRKMQTVAIKIEKEEMSRRDIVPFVTSRIASLLFNRTGLLAKEGGLKKAAKILSGLLKDILSDPFKVDSEDRTFQAELVYKALALEGLLRPSGGQWFNWRYFYAREPVVTEAFKLLSSQQQAWFIFTLMSGNDHGKLLALSILQDEKHLSVKDLATFFDAYLKEFGDLDQQRAEQAYRNLYGKLPDEEQEREQQLQGFRKGIADQLRLQLMWLTQNSAGRIIDLFEESANADVVARILLNFTVELPEAELIKGTYADLASKVANPSTLEEVQHDLVSREEIVEKILSAIDSNKRYNKIEEDDKGKNEKDEDNDDDNEKDSYPLSNLFGKEIFELLMDKKRKHTIPDKLWRKAIRNAQLPEKKFKAYCQQPTVAKIYIESGIGGFNQPVSAQTKIAYALACNNLVKVYRRENDQLVLQAIYKPADIAEEALSDSVVSIEVGRHDGDWKMLPEVVDHNYPLIDANNEAKNANESKYKNKNKNKNEDIKQEKYPHPMSLHAQRLFWSSNIKQQKEILKTVNRDYLEDDDEEKIAFEKQLFSVNSPENIDAIKQGVLQSNSLQILKPFLVNYGKRLSAYGVIAALLSDSKNGMNYQRILQKLVDGYDNALFFNENMSALSNSDRIKEFFNWLNTQQGSELIDEKQVRKRYTAIVITNIMMPLEKVHIKNKKQRIITLLKRAYPKKDMVTVFYEIRECFSGTAEGRAAYRHGFAIAFGHQLAEDQEKTLQFKNGSKAFGIESNKDLGSNKLDEQSPLLQNDKNHTAIPLEKFNDPGNDSGKVNSLSAEIEKAIIDCIIEGCKGDLLNDPKFAESLVLCGDFVKTIIKKIHLSAEGNNVVLANIIKLLCEKLQQGALDANTHFNLTLVLLNSLHGLQKVFLSKENILFFLKQMGLVRQASIAGAKTYKLHLDRENHCLALLDGKQIASTSSAHIESFNIQMAVYYLLQYQKDHKENSKKPKKQPGFINENDEEAAEELEKSEQLVIGKNLEMSKQLILDAIRDDGKLRCQNITLEDRFYLGNFIIGALSEFHDTDMMSEVLFLFFHNISDFIASPYAKESKIEEIPDSWKPQQYKKMFKKLCNAVGRGDIVTGITKLIMNVKSNTTLRNQFHLNGELNRVCNRMVVLALHQAFKAGKNHSQWFNGMNNNNQLSKNLLAILEKTGVITEEGATDKKKISDKFLGGNGFATAFEEMGINVNERSAICKTVCRAVVNNKAFDDDEILLDKFKNK